MTVRESMSRSEPPSVFAARSFRRVPNDFLNRYPGDIPQGTAVPHWAYFNVTVRGLPSRGRLYSDVW